MARMQHKLQRGMSLVEVCIALAIVALAAAVVLPAMSNVSRADLRGSASLTATILRSAYDQAALTGKTHRLTFSVGKNTILMETTEEALRFDGKSGAMVTAAQDLQTLYAVDSPFTQEPDDSVTKKDKKRSKKEEEEDAAMATVGNGPLGALLGINKLAQRAAKTNFAKVESWTLKGDAEVQDIWTDGMTSAVTEGEAYIYFFPNGYTQDALIHIADSEKRIFTVKLQPLTGKSEIIADYVEVPK